MKYYSIKDATKDNILDLKGLDIEDIQIGTFVDSDCIIATDTNLKTKAKKHDDVVEITKAEYDQLLADAVEKNKPKPTIEERLAILEAIVLKDK